MRPTSRSYADRNDLSGASGPARSALGLATPGTAAGADGEPRSGFGALPGAEFPTFVYVSVLAAFAWIMIAAWLAFARGMDADLPLAMAIVLAIVFFGLPIVIRHVARTFTHPKAETPGDFLNAPVETETEALPGSSAWLQVLIIPLALALAATLIGGAFLLVR